MMCWGRRRSGLPYSGDGSLRAVLAENEDLRPFVELPTKENGLDIEGFAIVGSKVLLGLRGPLLDGFATVVEIGSAERLAIDPRELRLHLLDLGGLGVRDLARFDGDVIILAGPVM